MSDQKAGPKEAEPTAVFKWTFHEPAPCDDSRKIAFSLLKMDMFMQVDNVEYNLIETWRTANSDMMLCEVHYKTQYAVEMHKSRHACGSKPDMYWMYVLKDIATGKTLYRLSSSKMFHALMLFSEVDDDENRVGEPLLFQFRNRIEPNRTVYEEMKQHVHAKTPILEVVKMGEPFIVCAMLPDLRTPHPSLGHVGDERTESEKKRAKEKLRELEKMQ